MRTICVSPDFPLNRRMRKAVLRGKLNVIREGEGEGAAAKSHVWKPIEDMPAEFSGKARAAENELQSLSQAWQKRRTEMNPQELEQFNRELNREWSIETGLIERAYHLERGTTRLLIERGFEEGLIPRHNGQDPAEVAAMLRDHENIVNALFDFVAGERELSVGYVKELHAEMLRAQKTVAGVDQFGNKTRIPMNHGLFKKRPNNPHTPEGKLHEYCPWEQVDSEMDRLMEMHKTHSAHSPLASAAWLHHRFVQIHPFEDGNGRIARCLATLVFIRAGWFPLVVPNEERNNYLDALQAADNGDLSPLVCAFAWWQKRFYFQMFPTEEVQWAREKLQAIQEISSDSVENVVSKNEMARELILQADNHFRSGKVHLDKNYASEGLAILERILRIAAHAEIIQQKMALSEDNLAMFRQIISECGEVIEAAAKDGVFFIVLASHSKDGK